MVIHQFRKQLCKNTLLVTVITVCLFALTTLYAFADDDERGSYLFICAGDQARSAPDFLAVINFDSESKNYGKVMQGYRHSAFCRPRRDR